jgi:hypothetical protein
MQIANQQEEKMAIAIRSHFSNNSIVIIKSLKSNETDTATTLHDHLQSISDAKSPRVEFHDAKSKQDVLDILDEVKEKSKGGMKPILHFETHGNKDFGLHIAASNEFISWRELADKFREINVVSNNNLGVVMAACFGLHAIKPITIFEASPYFILISSESPIEIAYINSQIWQFYDTLFSSGDIDTAMTAIDKQFVSFHAEKFFTRLVIGYFKDKCTGEAAEQRVERLLAEVQSNLPSRTPEQMESLRRSAQAFIEPQPETFYRLSEEFIIDQSRYTVTFEEIMSMVNAA